tara:strand:+ start:809 stop:3370 length:2562 start_codon:yes stop_codon:yes gene_type:complete
MKLIIDISQKKSNSNIGGKAKNLALLEEMNLSVPRWAVIPQEVLLNQIEDGKFNQEKLKVPSEILDELKSFFGSIYDSKTYAVRSSGIDEDGAEFSFAGQYDTFLHVPFSQLEEKIIDCWASSQSQRVLDYRKQNNINAENGIGVIIQEMIDVEISGIAFGINPLTGIPNSKVISSVYGLGEGLVSGELDGDTFTITGNHIESKIVNKSHFFTQNSQKSGIYIEKVAKKNISLPSLNDNQINKIVEVLDDLNSFFGKPQDIEFAFENDQFYLLQTRPITAIANQGKGEYTVWDNSNIIESYPGITTPLTFSFIIKMYEMVYRQFIGMMGVEKKSIEANSPIFENTLGLVRGRVYYNLLNWYKMLAMVPGYSINAENMERMMGVKEKFELKENFTMSKSKARWRMVVMVYKMIGLHFKLPKERKRFQKYLNEIISDYQSIDFKTKTSDEIIDLYNQFENKLLLKWKAPLINDFFAMIWFGMLEKKTQKHLPKNPTIHNDLLCGSQDIISVEPIHRTIEICELISKNEECKLLFQNNNKKEIWEELKNEKFPEVLKRIEDYIIHFGNRCVGELKLETISFSQDPALLIGILKSYLKQGINNKSINSNYEEELRNNATDLVNKAFKGKPLKKWGFNFVLRKTRFLVSNRENLRYERTRGFGMVRTMFSELGKRWKAEGYLTKERDIFYLELDEIKTQKGKSFDEVLIEQIKERKQEFVGYKMQEPPMERFYSFGNEFTDEFIYSTEKTELSEENLSGTGCCPGIVKGKVRIVEDPNEIDSLDGDILVTSSTDPGWVTLFPTASAILVERGSLLSHSAIVSREMGIPCIVSITGLLRTLKTGDLIEMNGSTGSIKLI